MEKIINNKSYFHNNRIFSKFFLPVIFLLFFTLLLNSQSNIDEDLLVGAYIERFRRFIEWSSDSYKNDQSKPFVIGVYNDELLTGKFEILFKDSKIQKKNVIVKNIRNINSIENLHILFFSNLGQKDLTKIISTCKSHSVLTNSYSQGYVQYGTIINLFLEGKNLKFEINNTAAKESGLKISHLLLQKAKNIK
jgi:hypothetical protein